MRQRTNIRLIVNADDFGYFDEVSRGILELMEAGAVTATGVMANGPALARWADRLRGLDRGSVGVHLNATLGRPLTPAMQALVGGEFPSKGVMGMALLRGAVPVRQLLAEWRAQIEHCRALGLRPAFVNSHEHVHVMPGLYRGVRALAREFGIAHVRAPRTEWGPGWSVAGAVRNLVFAVAGLAAPGSGNAEPELVGVSQSGRLDLDYCRWRFARFKRGRTYELMCHPGRTDPTALATRGLAAYHDWEGELRTFMSDDFRQVLSSIGIELITFAELQ